MENYCCRKFLSTGSTPSIIASAAPLSLPLSLGLPPLGEPPWAEPEPGRGACDDVPGLHPALWLSAEGRRRRESPGGSRARRGARSVAQRRVLKAGGPGPVCFGPARACTSGGGGSGGPREPLCPEELHRHGREGSAPPGGRSRPGAPAGSGAQSVPGTWGPSEEDYKWKQTEQAGERLARVRSGSGSARLRRSGTCPERRLLTHLPAPRGGRACPLTSPEGVDGSGRGGERGEGL